MCEHGDVVVVPTPDWFWPSRHRPEKGIAIDRCIADEIVAAWSFGVRTGGSCCGHGDRQKNVVLLDDTPESITLGLTHLPGFELLAWRLITVGGKVEN